MGCEICKTILIIIISVAIYFEEKCQPHVNAVAKPAGLSGHKIIFSIKEGCTEKICLNLHFSIRVFVSVDQCT